MQPKIDTGKPQGARMYDYFLGGKDHYAVDRETAEQTLRHLPGLRTTARENRAFLGRAVRHLAAEAGIRQFLDIGTGLPTANNVHQVAQEIAPQCRVVYADNDPVVLAHARALLTSSPEGRTAYIEADLREPEKILTDPAVRDTLDFTQPIALLLVAVLHFLPDDASPRQIMAILTSALPAGSYVVATHATAEYCDPQAAAAAAQTYQQAGVPFAIRSSDEFTDLVFTGLELVDPGVVVVSDWRPDGMGPRPLPAEVNFNGAVARKP